MTNDCNVAILVSSEEMYVDVMISQWLAYRAAI